MRFVGHYAEMVLVMLVGMLVLGSILGLVASAFGATPRVLGRDAPAAVLLGMGFSMTAPMVWWMRRRGHSGAANREMAGAMIVPTLGAVALLGTGALGDLDVLLGIQHVAMLPAMLGVMLLRRDEYSSHVGHAHTHGSNHGSTPRAQTMGGASHAHHYHHHHELPTSGDALNAIAFSATLHCLTGCAIGEVAGMVLGTALGWSDWATIALAVGLAFLFGYSLTSLPLLRAGLALSAVVPIALASDTFSIATMEVVDNAIMVVVPGAMASGVGDLLFWGALSFALVVAGVVAFPLNRWLITRGKGHAVLHRSGHHPNFPTRLAAAVAGVMGVFGAAVLVAEIARPDAAMTEGGEMQGHEPASGGGDKAAEADAGGEHGGGESSAASVPGLAVTDGGLKLELDRRELPRGERAELSFRVVAADGRAVRDYEVSHEKRMHLIVVRRDTRGFQHLHPRIDRDGRWSTRITVGEAGSYRIFADFKRGGESQTLGADLGVDGQLDWQALPRPSSTATTPSGYRVRLSAGNSHAGRETELRFAVTREGEPIHTEPYLGAGGHLVALREGDLGYLHTHPAAHGGEELGHDDAVSFATAFPSEGRYRLFFQFKHDGRVHTAALTREVER